MGEEGVREGLCKRSAGCCCGCDVMYEPIKTTRGDMSARLVVMRLLTQLITAL